MGSATVPLDRVLLGSYRLSIVTIPLSVTVWPRFAMKILTGGSDLSNLPFPWWTGTPVQHSVSCDHKSVPAKWHLISSNGFSRVHERDRR